MRSTIWKVMPSCIGKHCQCKPERYEVECERNSKHNYDITLNLKIHGLNYQCFRPRRERNGGEQKVVFRDSGHSGRLRDTQQFRNRALLLLRRLK